MRKNDAYCKGCVYRGKTSGDTTCEYILIEKKRRPCKPGDGCTVRVLGKKDRKKQFAEATT